MKTFLQETAEYLLQHESALHRQCLVLPSNRAAKILRDQLCSLSGKTMLLPEILGIASWMERLSGCRIPEEEEILLMLFEIHGGLHPDDSLSFQKFAGNAQMLLKDFNDIDISLADADKVFESLVEIKEMETEFRGDRQLSRRYLEFCRELPLYYRLLREKLSAKGLAYQGMLYRLVSGQLDVLTERLPYAKHLFIGFSALSLAEEDIITRLHREKKAEMIVDCDAAYLKETDAAEVPASVGKFIRHLKTRIDPVIFPHDFLHTEAKDIDILGLPQESSQAEILPELLGKYRAENPEASCVVVLLKEGLLLPVLYALPGEKLNISMEYRFSHTALYQLLHHYLAALENRERFAGSREGTLRLYHREVRNFFRNAFLQKRLELTGRTPDFSKDTRLFYRENEIRDKLLEAGQDEATAGLLCGLFFSRTQPVHASVSRLLQFLDHEALPGTHRRLLQFLKEHITPLFHVLQSPAGTDIISARLLAENMLARISIPFQSDAGSPLQIMGMLETRALDFEHVILLSVNEGVIPNAQSSRTLLPYDLRRFYGLPTYQNHEAIMTYHFYRLIQRARKVSLCYNTDNRREVSEKSRLILQLQTHWRGLPNIRFHEEVIPLPQSRIPEKAPLAIAKDGNIRQKLERFTFSPSSLNAYLACPLKFCLRYLLKLELPEEPDEMIEANTMGTVIHSILEKKLDPEHPDFSTDKLREELVAAFTDRELTGLALKKEEVCHEKNLLILELCHRYLKDYLQKFAKEVKAGGSYPVLKVEEKFDALELDIQGKTVRFSGSIDRIDRFGECFRILDYKTGFVDEKALKLEAMEDAFDGKHKEAFQLLLYMYLLNRRQGIPAMQGEIVSFQHPDKQLILGVAGKDVFDTADFQAFERLLANLLDCISDAAAGFQQTDTFNPDDSPCKYCDYLELCQ